MLALSGSQRRGRGSWIGCLDSISPQESPVSMFQTEHALGVSSFNKQHTTRQKKGNQRGVSCEKVGMSPALVSAVVHLREQP